MFASTYQAVICAEPEAYAIADLAFARASVLMEYRMTDAISASKLLQLANAITRAAVKASEVGDAHMASLFLEAADRIDTYTVSL